MMILLSIGQRDETGTATHLRTRKLDAIYGTLKAISSQQKKGWSAPLNKLTNADLTRLIRSEEIFKAVRPPKRNIETAKVHRNPLEKHKLMHRLNPYASALRAATNLRYNQIQLGVTL
ncbi:60S ribosomal protein L4 [Parelaphostrongylus tenuis]|uniref:60S ribosomal protein L4 n=1 Tax=Parelaphostrongylus tenuis TaxID=148309 RepID=A0AAD5QT57_PARTN|nr:60S ribosomal protein L4 [Parelaphostrongylus tenuis]